MLHNMNNVLEEIQSIQYQNRRTIGWSVFRLVPVPFHFFEVERNLFKSERPVNIVLILRQIRFRLFFSTNVLSFSSQCFKSLPSSTAHNLCLTHSWFSVTGLEEGQEYHFQVVSMSYNDYQLASNKISITVPSQKKMRAISLGLTSAVFFIAIVILIAYYIRKKWCQPYKKTEKLSPK